MNVKATMADGAIPEGYVAVPPSLDDFYKAMVDGFAMAVAERVGTINTEGGRITN